MKSLITHGILGCVALVVASISAPAASQPGQDDPQPYCVYRFVQGTDNGYTAAHNCCTYPQHCEENLWTDDMPSDDHCILSSPPSSSYYKTCGTRLEYGKLVSWYYGGTCGSNCHCQKDGNTVLQTQSAVTYVRYVGLTPCE